jgi:hypothetical protein
MHVFQGLRKEMVPLFLLAVFAPFGHLLTTGEKEGKQGLFKGVRSWLKSLRPSKSGIIVLRKGQESA